MVFLRILFCFSILKYSFGYLYGTHGILFYSMYSNPLLSLLILTSKFFQIRSVGEPLASWLCCSFEMPPYVFDHFIFDDNKVS